MNPIKAFLRRFRHARSGTSAVEFALMLPVMLSIYLGTYEVTQGLALDRLVKLNASTITNLVAQYTTISLSQDLPDVFAASAQVLAPYPSGKAVTTVTLIRIDGAGNAWVDWSKSSNGPGRAQGSPVAVPVQMSKPNTKLVLGETAMPYDSPIQFVPLPTWNLYGQTFMAPRASTTINQVP